MVDFEAAIDRAVAGLEKKNRVMNAKEKETVAYHEAGHTLIVELRATSDKVSKVSIIPRGIGALGFTQQLPTEDRYLMGAAVLDVRPAGYTDAMAIPSLREYSEDTARRIDAEMQRLLQESECRVTTTLTAKRKELEALAQLLLHQETVERDGLLRILEDRQHPPREGSARRDNSPNLSDAA